MEIPRRELIPKCRVISNVSDDANPADEQTVINQPITRHDTTPDVRVNFVLNEDEIVAYDEGQITTQCPDYDRILANENHG